jgi:glycine cleavage system H lipoate-binding protein
MRCLFLREETVMSCREAPAKALPLAAVDPAGSRCHRPDHVTCPYTTDRGQPASTRCPSLIEQQVQYCAAASPPSLIPAAEMLPSRCRTHAHCHCALFLERAGTCSTALGPGPRASCGPVQTVDGIAVPLDRDFTANHLWADRGTDGSCTVGVDAFLVRVVGRVDRVTFASPRAGAQPFAVLSVAGIDLPLVFPYQLDRVAINYSLRVAPQRLTEDPYGAGWLFEGYWPAAVEAQADAGRRLVRGQDAVRWMQDELERLSVVIHEQIGSRREDGLRLAADGGTFAVGVANALRREDALQLFSDFFPVANQRWMP